MVDGKTTELLAERSATHGDFSENARIAQCIKEIMRSSSGWRRIGPQGRESLEMIAHKIARIIAGNANFPDHWDDIAGYAKLSSDGKAGL